MGVGGSDPREGMQEDPVILLGGHAPDSAERKFLAKLPGWYREEPGEFDAVLDDGEFTGGQDESAADDLLDLRADGDDGMRKHGTGPEDGLPFFSAFEPYGCVHGKDHPGGAGGACRQGSIEEVHERVVDVKDIGPALAEALFQLQEKVFFTADSLALGSTAEVKDFDSGLLELRLGRWVIAGVGPARDGDLVADVPLRQAKDAHNLLQTSEIHVGNEMNDTQGGLLGFWEGYGRGLEACRL